MLALAVLGCDLKLLGCDWLSAILSLQTFAQTKGGELSICYEAVVPHYAQIASQYPLFIGVRRAADSSGIEVDSGGKEPASNERLADVNRDIPPSSVSPAPLTAKCSKETVASLSCSSPVKAAA